MRKTNWTDDQMLHLLTLIKIIRGPLAPAVTAEMKQQAWDAIASLINTCHLMVARTGEECTTVQVKGKECINNYKKGLKGAGGWTFS